MRRLLSIALQYLFPGIIGSLAGLVGIGSGIAGLVGGAPSVPTAGSQPWWIQSAGGRGNILGDWLNSLNNYSGEANALPGQVQPALGSSFNQQLGINYLPFLNAGQQAGGAYSSLAGAAGQAGSQLMGGANQLLQTSMDPQQALYNYTLGNLTDQVNAGQAQRGLGTSPVGGAEINEALSNFNIDWQNQQLQRQIQGLSGAGAGYGQALQNLAGVPTSLLASVQIPLQTQQTAAAGPGQAANQYTAGITSALGPLLQDPQLLYQYLSGGGTGVPQAVPQWNPYGGAGAALGTGLSQFGGSNWGGGLNNWLSNLFSSNSGGGGGGGTPQPF